MFSLLCRMCLDLDTRLLSIENTQLQTMFEQLSGSKLISADGRSQLICYICHAHLWRCWKLQKMMQNAETIITKLLPSGLQLTQDKLVQELEINRNLSLSMTKLVSMPDYVKKENPEIKEETFTVKVHTEGNHVIEKPLEFDSMTTTSIVKQEHCFEFYDSLLNVETSSLSASSQSHTKNSNIRKDTKLRGKVKRSTGKSPNSIPDYGLKPYSCVVCYKQFNQNTNLRKHMKSHIDTKLLKCIKCIETFTNKHDFDKHILVHDIVKFPCNLCENTFISKCSLKIHINHKHRGTKTYVCDTCNKSFNHKGTLHLHMRTHTGDKPHACNKCPKRFSQKGTLLRHVRMHTGEKPYACDKCTKTFNQESSLKRHIKMHNGVKPYTCNRCSKAYYESSHLTRHLRTHTGEKPYACDRCFQTFSQSSNLQSHMKKHTGVTPSNYVCHECNKAFDHKSIFKRHILKHTREKPYPCNGCDKKYADKRSLNRHIATHEQN